ncbi:helix-turn-helix domain-containing protein [Streptomyces sp. NPDC001339]|uniref:helix-turn-helix domain-containing protein n=1 Tax=Streptomyces sp. NPDC001339 TaxID=3364563 RepID=UPI0036BBBD58
MTIDPEQLSESGLELAAMLKEERKRAGLTGDRLARRMNVSQSTVSRIENGKVRPTLVDVERYLRGIDSSPDTTARVMELARVANTEWQGIRSLRQKGLEKKQLELSALESSCTEFRYFLLSMITSLISTPEYIRASLAHSPVNTEQVIAKKLERQRVLYETSKSFTFILTEQAVTWPLVSPPAMGVQIDHLAALTRLPNVRLGVIPRAGVKPMAPMDTFTVYDDTLATVETTAGIVVLRDPRDIETHTELFSIMESYALFGEAARSKLREWSAMARDDL